MKPKILFIKQGLKYGWYMETYFEYLIRNLGSEYFMELANTINPPYKEDYLKDYPITNPLMRNPNNYDLLVPVLGTHWHLPKEEFRHKVGIVSWEVGEGLRDGLPAVVGAATPECEKAYKEQNIDYVSVRMGIDTDMFRPLDLARDDKLFRVGIVGNVSNDRHSLREIYRVVRHLKDVRLMVFMHFWETLSPEVLGIMGGRNIIYNIVDAGKYYPGLANMYNSMDVLLRIEKNEDYGMPVMEAAACGVPSIATDWGNCKDVIGKDRGILINKNKDIKDKISDMIKAIKYLKNNRRKAKGMGFLAMEEIEYNWTWSMKRLSNWRKFFKKGLANVRG